MRISIRNLLRIGLLAAAAFGASACAVDAYGPGYYGPAASVYVAPGPYYYGGYYHGYYHGGYYGYRHY